ncbi:SDR family NAD(P)-dependent oxidoreductase [Chrysosporum ovalisporum APH033B]|uniref:type I polyketide synthase n=1 Tax=Umezakia ovalisporum TaxID=75695 RepID=UPI0024733209|nr:type I polyketide synthase [Umezakia ovalisporum]MDH6068005.1 SDR family NAD(P)-dependent oxidoreductase [Umezakia ovalisporum APH033B]
MQERESPQILLDGNGTQSEFPDSCIHHLFEDQAARRPDAIALIEGEQSLTYRELNVRANHLAQHLLSLGCQSDDLVAICIERSAELFIGLLGILKAGCAYVPLDVGYPVDRIEYMLRDSDARILLTSTDVAKKLALTIPALQECQTVYLDQEIFEYDFHFLAIGKLLHNQYLRLLHFYFYTLIQQCQVFQANSVSQEIQTQVLPNNLAYCIYTSGSTGNPKGILMEHRSLVNMLWWHQQTRPSVQGVRTLQFCAVSFDFSCHEIFSTLCLGGILVLVPEAVRQNPFALAEFISQQKIEKLFLPVTALLQLAEAVNGNKSTSLALCEVITTGEQMQITPAVANLFQKTGAILHNHYGATEFQDATTHTLNGNPEGWPTLVPVGRPLHNVQVYILDEAQQPVPVGEEGELCIGGIGLARGYHNLPDLTNEKFIPNPFGTNGNAKKLYRTGDLARYLPDGTIEHLGRIDHQVKIRGFRVELGEIESVLTSHQAVRECAVVAREIAGHTQLVGYILAKDTPNLSFDKLEPILRQYSEAVLPEYMIPTRFINISNMPLTPSGKLDRRALPDPKGDRPALSTPLVKPRTQTEKRLAEIWGSYLAVDIVGIQDNFFDLGGTSLLLTQAHKFLCETFNINLSAVSLFQYPTIQTLAQYIDCQGDTTSRDTASRHKKVRRKQSGDSNDIAIISVAGRFPGAETIEQFWHNLCNGVESITLFSDDELEQTLPELFNNPAYVKAGAVLEGVELFDATFFGYSPKEAAVMDPQQRILLECAWEAFERAGYNPETYPEAVGVYAGSSLSTYLLNNIGSALGIITEQPFIETDMEQFQAKIGNDRSYLATRISHKLNLKGPSVNVQTACSTSLVAVHMACQSLISGECQMALAGGISVVVPHKGGYLYEEGMVRSQDGHCRAFDAKAQGTIFGNGGGLVLLKRLQDALDDNDNIMAVIKATAINNDGALKIGYTAPSVDGQADVISEAIAIADIDASTIGYVEAHGTGTQLGDPIEVAGLARAFQRSTESVLGKQQCAIGSVKTNIGHLDEAAGIAGLIKVALALQYGQIPPSLHYANPNPRIDFDATPFFVNTELREWSRNGYPLRAGVSSFGVGGTNSHIVLEESPVKQPTLFSSLPERSHHLLTLSAHTQEALHELVQRYIQHNETHLDIDLGDLCFTANTGRKHFEHRLAVVAESIPGLQAQLETAQTAISAQKKNAPPTIAFLFTGQGSQYINMGRTLYDTESTFRAALDRCETILQNLGIESILSVIFGSSEHGLSLDDTAYTQPALFAIEYALYQLWKSWGIQPSVVIGHSAGEYVSACVAGVFSLEDGLKLIAERGRLIQALPRDGSMVSVMASEKRIADIILPYGGQVAIAAINGPQSVVISGQQQAIDAICAILETEGIKSKKLNVSHAFHSPLVEAMLDSFLQVAQEVTYSEPQIKLISNVTGTLASHESCPDELPITTAEYWVRHVRQPVRFAAGMESLEGQGVNVFIEIGPKPVLLGMGRDCLPEQEGLWLPSLRPKQDDWQQVLSSLRDLYLAGVTVDWSSFHQGYARRRVPLPTYPWQRERHWVEPIIRRRQSVLKATNTTKLTPNASVAQHPLLGQRLHLSRTQEIYFQTFIHSDFPIWVADHKVFGNVIIPGVAYFEMALAAGKALKPDSIFWLEDVSIAQALIIPDEGQTVQIVLSPQEESAYFFEILSLEKEKSWVLHASGKLVAQEQVLETELIDLIALQAHCSEEVSVDVLYQEEMARRLDMGPMMRGVKQLWRYPLSFAKSHDAMALAKVSLPEILLHESNAYQFHPVILDAGLQMITVSYPEANQGQTYVPVGMEGLQVYGRPSSELWCRAQYRPPLDTDQRQGIDLLPKKLIADLHLFDTQGRVVAIMFGVQSVLVGREAMLRSQDTWRNWLYQVLWKPQACFGLLPNYLPTPDKIRKRLETKLATLIIEANLATYAIAYTQLERLSLAYVVATFRQMGWLFQPGERFSTAQKVSALGIVDQHRQLFARLLDILAEADIIRSENSMTTWEVISYPETIDIQVLLDDLEAKEAEAEVTLVSRCSAKLAEVLQGKCDPIQLLFPAGDTTTLSKIYREAPVLRVTNTLVQEALVSALEQLPPERGWRILEIGAGTGGTTAYLLPHLPGNQTKYVFTDISAFFLAKAEERFKDYPFVSYQVLDIEQAPQAQGFEPQIYDLIVAADVLHATSDLRQTLAHIRQLLAPGGMLILMEDSEPARWADLTFGLTEGWWKFTDCDLRPNHPLLSPEQWQILLSEMGFSQTTALWPKIDSSHKLPREAVIVARNEPVIRTPRRWLLLADEGIGGLLAKQLREEGEDCILLLPGEKYTEGDSQTFTINPGDIEEWQQLLNRVPSIQEIVHCWSMVSTDLDRATIFSCSSTLHLVQALAKYPKNPRLSLVTLGAQAVNEHHVQNVVGSVLWGMGKVIALEHPELQVAQVDLDPNGTVEAQVQVLRDELLARKNPASATSVPDLQTQPHEKQIAFREQTRYVARLSPLDRPNPRGEGTQEAFTFRDDGSYLIAGGLGGLGLVVARFLVTNGARYLVLVGRRGAREEQQAQLSELEQLGASVKVLQADIADAEQLAQALSAVTYPPLRGVIHAAGTLNDGILQQQSWQAFKEVMNPKVAGAWNLHTLTKNQPLDFFVLFSSATSLLGNPGQANHAAANAFLDGLASYRRHLGLPSLSINWGTWREVGIAARLGLDKLSNKQGEGTITLGQGLQILEQLLKDENGVYQVGVMPINWTQFLARQLTPQPFFSDAMKSIDTSLGKLTLQERDSCPQGYGHNIREQLENAPPKEGLTLLQAHVQEQVSQVLGIDTKTLLAEQDVGFFTLGMDSLTSIELRNRLQASLGCSLSSTLAFDYPTQQALVNYLANELLGTSEQLQNPESDEEDEISSMDDIVQLLSAKLEMEI